MKRKDYKVIFKGQILPGFSEAEVKNNLARLFNADAQRIDRLFQASPMRFESLSPGKKPANTKKPLERPADNARL